MPIPYEHPQFRQMGNLLLALYDLAAITARATAKQLRHSTSRRRNLTLKPGSSTPLWNELVKQALPHLAKRGRKAQLARYLGVPRQRLQTCLKARAACLDAERTLLLLAWVTARQQDRELLV